ncbi:MAG: hypothetical protein A2017_07310 [Lentisphaerae bacterium GWF2_44_16]|nr:MAG: hypothetical protein A2017_07310 [Lentisphaerae bacterium GWF2_44_16]
MKSKILFLFVFLSYLSVANASEPDNIVDFLQKISGTLSPSKDEEKAGARKKRRSSDTNNPAIQNIVTARSFVDNNADGIASVFPDDTPVIYVCFDYSGFKSGEMIQSIWYRAESKGNWEETADDSVTIPFSGASNVCELRHGIPAGTKWKTGTYKVDIIARSRVIGSIPFTISESSKLSDPAAGNVFDLTSPLPEADDKFELPVRQDKVQSIYSVNQKSAENDTVKLKYQGSPGGGVFNGDSFSVSYQNGWKYVQTAPDTVIFTNFEGDADIVLQRVASLGNGGVYKDISAALADAKSKLRAFQDCNISKENEFTHDNVKYKPFSASYIRNGKNFQEWYVIKASPGNKFFYLFRYSSSPEKYNKYIGAARIMFASLTINGQADEKTSSSLMPPSVPGQSK